MDAAAGQDCPPWHHQILPFSLLRVLGEGRTRNWSARICPSPSNSQAGRQAAESSGGRGAAGRQGWETESGCVTEWHYWPTTDTIMHTHATHNHTDRSIKAEKWCTVVSEVITGLSFNLWTNKDMRVHFIWKQPTTQDLAAASFIPDETLFSAGISVSEHSSLSLLHLKYNKFMLSFQTKLIEKHLKRHLSWKFVVHMLWSVKWYTQLNNHCHTPQAGKYWVYTGFTTCKMACYRWQWL